jgi:hypothetical protein
MSTDNLRTEAKHVGDPNKAYRLACLGRSADDLALGGKIASRLAQVPEKVTDFFDKDLLRLIDFNLLISTY